MSPFIDDAFKSEIAAKLRAKASKEAQTLAESLSTLRSRDYATIVEAVKKDYRAQYSLAGELPELVSIIRRLPYALLELDLAQVELLNALRREDKSVKSVFVQKGYDGDYASKEMPVINIRVFFSYS